MVQELDLLTCRHAREIRRYSSWLCVQRRSAIQRRTLFLKPPYLLLLASKSFLQLLILTFF